MKKIPIPILKMNGTSNSNKCKGNRGNKGVLLLRGAFISWFLWDHFLKQLINSRRGPPPSRQHDNYYPRGGDRGGDPRGGGMDRHNNRGGPRGNNSSHYSSHHAQESKRIIDQ